MKKILAVACVAFLSLGGCSAIDQIPDDQLQHDLNIGAMRVVSFGLKTAFKKFPAEAQKIAADGKIALDILEQNLIPAFDGASTKEVARSVLDTAFALLKSKVKDERVIEVADVAVDLILANVKLPKNPTDKLDERTRKILLGIFTGMAEGARAALPKATAPDPAREKLTIPSNP